MAIFPGSIFSEEARHDKREQEKDRRARYSVGGGGVAGGAKGGTRKPPPRRLPIGSNSTGHYSTPISVPQNNPGPIQPVAPPSIEQYLGGDTTYQQQLRGFGKSLADFLAAQKLQNSKITQDYAAAQRAMNQQKVGDLKDIENDFASRGLLSSGLYAGAVGDYNTDFLQKLGQLTTQEKRSLADLLTQKTNFISQQKLDQQKAREGAINRRAAKFGLG